MPSLRLLLVRLFPKIRGINKSPPASADKTYLKNRRRHATVNISHLSNKIGKVYFVKRGESWGDDMDTLVPLDEFDAEFLKSRAYGKGVHEEECIYGFEEGSGDRLSSNFTPAPHIQMQVAASHKHADM